VQVSCTYLLDTEVEGTLSFGGLDCLDETPLLDLKPDRCEFTPQAQQQTNDLEAE